MSRLRSLHDQANSFGWISIALHWISTIAVILLWFIGQSIAQQSAEEIDARRTLHITIGLVAWLPIVGRILWRFMSPHPHVNGQTLLTHRVAVFTHYAMLAVLGAMIASGPVMAWAIPDRTAAAQIALAVHSTAARLLLVLVILHILAALKHLMFHDDETIARIFMPRKEDNNS